MFTTKLKGRYIGFPYSTWSQPCIFNIPHQSGLFITPDELTLTYHNHQKSTVYAKFDSWCYRFYGSGKMEDNVYQLIIMVSYRVVSEP